MERTRERVYKFVVEFKEAHDGTSPTLDEIAVAIDIGKSTVVHHIREDERLIRRGVRWIEVVDAE